MNRISLAFVLALPLFIGCDSGDECGVPGTTQQCFACGTTTIGSQVCTVSGDWGPCLCGNPDAGGVDGGGIDSGNVPAAMLIDTQPAPGAVDVAPDVVIEFRLTQAIDSSTVGAFSFTQTEDGAEVTGAVSVDEGTLRFVPDAPLAPEREYEARITRELLDIRGQPIAGEYWFVFTTAAPAALSLVSSEPENGATGVERTTDIRLTFDRQLDPATVTDANVSLTRVSDSADLFVNVSLEDGVTIVMDPSSFDIGESYRATVGTGLTDLGGAPLATDVVVEFATGDELSVISVSPMDGATEVSINEPLVITFDADIDPASVTAETVIADARVDIGFGGATVMPGTATVSGNTVTFTPEGGSWQEYETTFRVTLRTSEIRGTAGQVLSRSDVGSFTTPFHDPLYYYYVHTAAGGRGSYLAGATGDVTMGASSPNAQWYFTELSNGTMSMRTLGGRATSYLECTGSDFVVRMDTFFASPPRPEPPANNQWNIASAGGGGGSFEVTPGDSAGIYFLNCEGTGAQVMTSAAGVSMTSRTRRTDQLWWFERGPLR